MSSYIRNEVNRANINIIIFGSCDGGWSLRNPRHWLNQRVDIVIKFEWSVKAEAYNNYKIMLQPDGKLIKFPLIICKKWVSHKYIQDRLYNFQYFMEIRLRWLSKKIIPNEIKQLIAAYCQTKLIEETTKEQIIMKKMKPINPFDAGYMMIAHNLN